MPHAMQRIQCLLKLLQVIASRASHHNGPASYHTLYDLITISLIISLFIQDSIDTLKLAYASRAAMLPLRMPHYYLLIYALAE